jgi:hypothetical protein
VCLPGTIPRVAVGLAKVPVVPVQFVKLFMEKLAFGHPCPNEFIVNVNALIAVINNLMVLKRIII